ncbi:MAG: hypothetical protein ACTSV6_04105 [Candidatus Heimdallarchaeota archaeon]
MSKAQTDVISAVIIVIIAIGLVSSAYLWGLPLIQKRQDSALAERVFNSFSQTNENSLSSKIEFIANNGGEDTFFLDVNGLWVLDQAENSISFTFFSRASNIGSSAWVPLTTGATCPPTSGTVGIDKPSVVCARADALGNGYNITYKIWFRALNESTSRGYKIVLLPYSASVPQTSTGKSVRIFRGNVYTDTTSIPGQTLIVTEIKILFG